MSEHIPEHHCHDENHDGRCDDYLDHVRIAQELERDKTKWKVRTRFARVAFWTNILVILFCLISPIFLNHETVSNIQEFNSVIITLIGFNSAIVMVYIGAQSWIQDRENNLFYPSTSTNSYSSYSSTHTSTRVDEYSN